MYRRLLVTLYCLIAVYFATPAFSANDTINLNASNVLGTLNLDTKQLQSIKKAIEKTLKSNAIDEAVECGEVRMDCEVRTARTWNYNGDQFREVVVTIHTVGNASITLRNHGGAWPAISVK